MTIFRRARTARTIRSAASVAPGKHPGSCRLLSRASRNSLACAGSAIPRFSSNCATIGDTPAPWLNAAIFDGSWGLRNQRATIVVLDLEGGDLPRTRYE